MTLRYGVAQFGRFRRMGLGLGHETAAATGQDPGQLEVRFRAIGPLSEHLLQVWQREEPSIGRVETHELQTETDVLWHVTHRGFVVCGGPLNVALAVPRVGLGQRGRKLARTPWSRWRWLRFLGRLGLRWRVGAQPAAQADAKREHQRQHEQEHGKTEGLHGCSASLRSCVASRSASEALPRSRSTATRRARAAPKLGVIRTALRRCFSARPRSPKVW